MQQSGRAKGIRRFVAGWGKTVLGRLVFGLGLGRRLLASRAVIVAFHRVQGQGPNDAMTIPTAQFREWCRFFQKHFRVVPLEGIVGKLERGEALAGELAITFDDGYLDFQTEAVPVLASLGLPATVFAVSDYVGTDIRPWWDTVQAYPFMDWTQLGTVAAQGFAVGSHGKSHAAMDELTPAAAMEELVVSKAVLEAGLGRPVVWYAYPFGHPEKMPEAARESVRQAGYRACLGYGGLIGPQANPFRLDRVCVNGWFSSPYQFGGYLVALYLRYLLGRIRE